jgi:molecular chaperone DnaJ
VQVKADPFFERHEHDLVCKVPVSYAQAALGAEIEVPTLTGTAKLKIPAGSQPNDLLRMRGLGVPNERGRAGDQIVVVQITIPKRTTDRQKELLKELGEIEDKAGEQKSFFDRMKKLFE